MEAHTLPQILAQTDRDKKALNKHEEPTSIRQLLDNTTLWRGSNTETPQSCVSTGIRDLDALLPGNGWPQYGVFELLTPGSDEIRFTNKLQETGIQLLLPRLKAIQEKRWILWVSPPYIPYAPGLDFHMVDYRNVLVVHCRPHEQLWTIEQGLKSGACSVVLGWPNQHLSTAQLKRLHLAAITGKSQGFLLRPSIHAQNPSPCPVRIEICPTKPPRSCNSTNTLEMTRNFNISVKILKRRGAWPLLSPQQLTLTTYPVSELAQC
ncbi:MAG: hypothetical protein MI864_13705 [Pseudomonadales bacterium]|uniref:ImuA family protein n=1 Tax=Oleiphilus messinensis TaxID=141451 RepID=UPI0018E037AD|nr:hypothetical protein [Oleiphilus messinensis]MCG8611581.1 hypothetical protein [Pseudomonadales bacterium]